MKSICLIFIIAVSTLAKNDSSGGAAVKSIESQPYIVKDFYLPVPEPEPFDHKAMVAKITNDIPSVSLSKRITDAVEDKGRLISIKYKNGDLKNILRLIARVSGLNLVAGPQIEGKVTIELNDVHWEQALSLVLSVNGYTYIKDGNIIRVLTLGEVESEPLVVKIIPINYAQVSEVIPSIAQISTPERGKLQGDKRSNVLIVTDTAAKIAQIESVVERLDQPTPQVLIECKFIEIAQGDNNSIGVDWSNMGDYGVVLHDMLYTFDKEIQQTHGKTMNSGTESYVDQKSDERNYDINKAWQYALEPDQFRLAISMLLNDSKTKLISNPKVQTLDNQEATIRIAQTHYKPSYTFNPETGTYEINDLEEIYVGITLTVTPHINYDDYITLDVMPEVSNLEGNQIIQGVEVPITNIRQVKTRVSLKDRYTVAIGGLIRDDWVETKRSIPYLGDLPGLGKELFTWNSRELQTVNIVIFLTPTIVRNIEPMENWNEQLKNMQVTADGVVQNSVSNAPTMKDFFLHEQSILIK